MSLSKCLLHHRIFLRGLACVSGPKGVEDGVADGANRIDRSPLFAALLRHYQTGPGVAGRRPAGSSI